MIVDDLQSLQRLTPHISADAKYWFMRTSGGTLFLPFLGTSSIAMGHKAIKLSFIKGLKDGDDGKEALKAELKRHPSPRQNDDDEAADLSGLHASQLLRFCKEMKRGDVVVAPSAKTEHLLIGFINDDAPFEETLKYEGKEYPEFEKRRKVKWVRNVDGFSINPKLTKLFLNPQAIVDASDYSNWIDPLLYQFFRKGDSFHYVLRVESTEHIKAHILFGAVGDLFDLAKGFAEKESISTDFESVETRVNLNSPGDVELWVHAGVATMAFLSVIVVCLAGGGLHLNVPFTSHKLMDLKTDGLIAKVNTFLNDGAQRKRSAALTQKLTALNVKTPEQLLELLDAAEKKKTKGGKK